MQCVLLNTNGHLPFCLQPLLVELASLGACVQSLCHGQFKFQQICQIVSAFPETTFKVLQHGNSPRDFSLSSTVQVY